MSLLLALLGGGGPATITGTLAATDGSDTAAFVGDVCHVGTLAVTEGSDAAVFAGDVCHVGTLAATDGLDSAAFAGDIDHTGTLAATDSADAFAASGDVIPAPKTITGDLAVTDSVDTAAFSGDVAHVGDLLVTDGTDSFESTGFIAHVGTLGGTDGTDSASLEGVITSSVGSGGYPATHPWITIPKERKKPIPDIGIVEPEIAKAVVESVEKVVKARKIPNKEIDLAKAEKELRSVLKEQNIRWLKQYLELLMIEYYRIEQDNEDAQIAMLLFDM